LPDKPDFDYPAGKGYAIETITDRDEPYYFRIGEFDLHVVVVGGSDVQDPDPDPDPEVPAEDRLEAEGAP
jgi:hypothetical protein